MNETHREDPRAPLSYYGARRIVWLVFFAFIIWLILRALQPVILLFALVLLLAMVLNPIVVWLQKHRVPRFLGVILVMLALIAVTTTIILFAIPPLTRQLEELMHSAPNMWQGIRTRIEALTTSGAAVVMASHHQSEWPASATHELELVRGRARYAGPLRGARPLRGSPSALHRRQLAPGGRS